VPVLVTGATGFLGRHLVARLLARGDTVRAYVRPRTDVAQLTSRGVEVVRGELADRDALRRAASGCRLVFHLAGIVGHERSDAARLLAVNVDGVRSMVAALESGARLVHVSSVAAVGPAPAPDRPADESQPFPPFAERFVYARTKRLGEQVALEAAARGADVVVANPGFLIGPEDVYRVSTWAVGRYLAGVLRILEPGGLSYVDARDVASGLLGLAERGRRGERTILTSRDGNLSHQAFFDRVGAVTGRRRRTVLLPARAARFAARLVPWPVKPGEVEAAACWWFYDPAKAERELGFAARPLEETIAATAAQYLK
jgi:dihydroflavonol-4-reductase